MENETQIEKIVEIAAISIVPLISTTAMIFSIITGYLFTHKEFKTIFINIC
jgi:hypothetical protein